jgi:hypothetical protein
MTTPEDNEDCLPGSVDPSGLRRLLFWIVSVAGTFILLFTWLLLFVPGRPDFTGDFIIRTSASALFVLSILMARWIWKIGNPFSDRHGSTPMRFVLTVVWIELGISLYEVLGTVTYRLFSH